MKPVFALLLFLISTSSFGQCSITFNSSDATCYNLCDGFVQSVTSGDAPIQYSWSNGATSSVLSNLCIGTYVLTITDNLGCTVTDSVTIGSPPELIANLTLLNSPSATGVCDAQVSNSGQGGAPPYFFYRYDCLLDSVLPNNWQGWPPLFCPGDFAVLIVDGNGCVDTSDCITIVDIANDQCGIDLISTSQSCHNICDGEVSLTLTGVGPFQFNWSTGDSSSDLDSLCSGSYTVTMIDSQGCTLTESFSLTNPNLNVVANWITNTTNTNSCDGMIDWTATGGNPNYSIEWFECSTHTPYTPNPDFCAGQYFCVVTDQNLCTDTSDCASISTVGISELNYEPGMFIYPNPAKDVIYLTQLSSNYKTIQIIDMSGRLIITTEAISDNLDISYLESGLYLVFIETDKERLSYVFKKQ